MKLPSCVLFFLFINRDTNSSAATSDCTKGTGFQSTGVGRPGTLLPYRRCSIHGRRCKTTGRLCAATNHKGDIECEALPVRGSAPAQARVPKYPRTLRTSFQEGHMPRHCELISFQTRCTEMLYLCCLVTRHNGRFLLQHTNELTHPRRMVGPGARRNHHAVDYRL